MNIIKFLAKHLLVKMILFVIRICLGILRGMLCILYYLTNFIDKLNYDGCLMILNMCKDIEIWINILNNVDDAFRKIVSLVIVLIMTFTLVIVFSAVFLLVNILDFVNFLVLTVARILGNTVEKLVKCIDTES
jgi:hypothetical protein